MNKSIIGVALIVVSLLLAKCINLNGLDTASIAILMGFAAIAWIGVSFLIPNPAGPNFSMMKMLLKGALGSGAMILMLVLGLSGTKNHIDKELKEFGVTTEAIVIDKDYNKLPAKRGQVNYIYNLTLKFTDKNGVGQQLKSEVGESVFKSFNPGSSVRIKYSSRNKNIHKLVFE